MRRKILYLLLDLKFNLLDFISLGKNILYCPICGAKNNKFISFGFVKRENALCPRCKSLERHRLLWLYLKKETNLFKQELKVLHFAPEISLRRKFRKFKHWFYKTADFYKKTVDFNYDISNIDCDKETYDLIICNHVLEHIKDDKKAISELYRILKNNGKLIVMLPIDKNLEKTIDEPMNEEYSSQKRLELFNQEDHVRLCASDYIERLKEYFPEAEIVNYYNQFSSKEVKRFSILDEDIYMCVKKDLKR